MNKAAPCILYLSLCFEMRHTSPPLYTIQYHVYFILTLTNTPTLLKPYKTLLSLILAPSTTAFCTMLCCTLYLHILHHHHECLVSFTKPNTIQQHHTLLYSVTHLQTVHPVNNVIQPGVFYQTQRSETTCEMRHYIIAVTRSHADHHLHQNPLS